MSTTRIGTAQKSRKPRRTVAAAIVGATVMVTSLVTAPPASAAYAQERYAYYYVCANSLTQYNNGYVQTLDWNDLFYVDHFAGSGHVWGYGWHNGGSRKWGWVYNGWFC